MTRFSLRTVNVLLLTALTAACSDRIITGPAATLPEFAAPAFATVASAPLSQTLSADTVVTVFVLGTDKRSATLDLGFGSSIQFPSGAASVCNIAKSSYGVGTWDSACAASTTTVKITAKIWLNAKGKLSTEFSPAMRFVPASTNAVTLSMLDDGTGKRIDYCTAGSCVDESKQDATMNSMVGSSNITAFGRSAPQVSRRIKHFSGYTVTAD